jgi:hypothetical protein
MIKREQYDKITSGGGGGSGATQNEIYQIFEGTNPQGIANSLFETLSGNNNALSNLLIEDKSGNFETAANLLFFLEQYLQPNVNNGLNIANQLSETISGGDQTLANLLVDSVVGSNQSAANLLYDIANSLNAQRTPKIIETTTSGTIGVQIHNISIANTGNATGTITVDGTTINLPSGISINYNAGGLNNRFAVNKFSYNATGTTFLINYVQ